MDKVVFKKEYAKTQPHLKVMIDFQTALLRLKKAYVTALNPSERGQRKQHDN